MEKSIEEKLDRIISELSDQKKLLTELSQPKTTNEKERHEEMVDSEVICNLFKISKKTLWNYRKKELVPFHKIAGKVYFYKSDVEQALKEHYYGVKTSESNSH